MLPLDAERMIDDLKGGSGVSPIKLDVDLWDWFLLKAHECLPFALRYGFFDLYVCWVFACFQSAKVGMCS